MTRDEREGIQRPAPDGAAFLEMGFRPLYIAGCGWAMVAIILWIWVPQVLTGALGGVIWHAHEMLWAFVATIAVGFLLTATANWTGVNPLYGRPLGGLTLMWCVARVGFLVPNRIAFVIAAMGDLIFFIGSALAIGTAIFRKRNWRNYGVPFLVAGLGVANGLFLWAVWTGASAQLMPRFQAGLLCMAVLALLVARRVIPFFATWAVPDLRIPMHARSGQWQLGAGGLAIVCLLLDWTPGLIVSLAVAGILAIWQVWAWQPWSVRREPLLWILYWGYAGLGAGLLLAAVQTAGWIARAAWPIHVISVAGFSVLIIGMVTRTSLGHLGRPLRADRIMVTAFALVIATAVLRLTALLPTAVSRPALHLAAGAWVLGFGLYLWRFVPLLVRPSSESPVSGAILKPATLVTQRRKRALPTLGS